VALQLVAFELGQVVHREKARKFHPDRRAEKQQVQRHMRLTILIEMK
jgi:hypothetical protein